MFHPVPTFTENLTFPFHSFWIIFKWRWRAHSVWWVHTLNNKFILQSTGKAFLNKAWLLSNDEICEEISPLVPSCPQWSAISCVLNCSAILTQDEPTLYLSLDRIPLILFPTFVNFQVERLNSTSVAHLILENEKCWRRVSEIRLLVCFDNRARAAKCPSLYYINVM